MESILDRIERGNGRQQDADLLLDMSDNIGGKSLCALGDAAIGPVISSVRKFRKEYEHHVTQKTCLPDVEDAISQFLAIDSDGDCQQKDNQGGQNQGSQN